jgi:hypothetical protein
MILVWFRVLCVAAERQVFRTFRLSQHNPHNKANNYTYLWHTTDRRKIAVKAAFQGDKTTKFVRVSGICTVTKPNAQVLYDNSEGL